MTHLALMLQGLSERLAMSKDKAPEFTKEQVEYLESLIPPKDFDDLDTIDEIRFYSGQRHVVKMLRHKYNKSRGLH
jgi:hypothetical protein